MWFDTFISIHMFLWKGKISQGEFLITGFLLKILCILCLKVVHSVFLNFHSIFLLHIQLVVSQIMYFLNVQNHDKNNQNVFIYHASKCILKVCRFFFKIWAYVLIFYEKLLSTVFFIIYYHVVRRLSSHSYFYAHIWKIYCYCFGRIRST